MCTISKQKYGQAIIPKHTQSIILKNINDQIFIFSVGRELEFKGNLSDGIALISFQNQNVANQFKDIFGYQRYFSWQGHWRKHTGILVRFYDYFDYLDYVYSADDLSIILRKLNESGHDDFRQKIYSQLLKDRDYLKDLLGTKYIRENRLSESLKVFEDIDAKYWEDNYNAWEKGKYDGSFAFDKNPFYDIEYTPSFIPHRDTFQVNKLTVIQHLINYLNLAENTNTINKAYYYFISANCYLNMSRFGNSWMMRRLFFPYGWTTDGLPFIDDHEYWNNNLAVKYYNLAYRHSNSSKFKALCLRMIDYINNHCTSDQPFELLKAQYPQYYSDLSNCDNLEEYFKMSDK